MSAGYAAAVLAGPIALAVGRSLPPEGLGLALRLAGAGACVLLLPGALAVRSLGGVRGFGAATAGALAASLTIVAFSLTLVFAAGSSLTLAVAVLAVFLAAALVADLAGAGTANPNGAPREAVGAGSRRVRPAPPPTDEAPAGRAPPVRRVSRRRRSRENENHSHHGWHALAPSRWRFARRQGSGRLALAGLVAVAVAYAAVVWWAAGPPQGDALQHLARVRKLVELDALPGLTSVDEFRDGGLHPGYAFPLWHGALALVARLAGVDSTDVVVHLSALLVPLALVVAFGAGAAVFRSWVGGTAVAAFQLAQFGLSREGTGSFASLDLPATFALLVVVPAVIALAFAFLEEGGAGAVLALAAAAFVLAAIHPSYALYVALVLAAAFAARVLFARADAGRFAIALAAVVVPAGAFLAWLLPVARSTASYSPDPAERVRSFAHYAGQVVGSPDAFRLAPEALTRGGPVVVAGLLAIPLAALAPRRRWSALVLGSSFAIFALLLLTPLFTIFSDQVSLSQSRRLAGFLPLPFALAGAALLAGRLRWAAPLAGLAAGLTADLAYTSELTYRLEQGGPAWPVWVGAGGAAVGLVVAAVLARRGREIPAPPTLWAALAAFAFVLPVAVGGLAELHRAGKPDRYALTPGIVRELRTLEPGAVVFASLEASYRAAAYAPVSIVAAPPGHVADTDENRPYERRRDVLRFFSDPRTRPSERRAILAEYGTDWLLVDTSRRYPSELVAALPVAYRDGRYLLVRVST